MQPQNNDEMQNSNVSNEMFVYVEEDSCIGCGMCVAMCDKVFAFNKNGKSHVIKQPSTKEEMDCAKDAVEGCCVSAIKIGPAPNENK